VGWAGAVTGAGLYGVAAAAPTDTYTLDAAANTTHAAPRTRPILRILLSLSLGSLLVGASCALVHTVQKHTFGTECTHRPFGKPVRDEPLGLHQRAASLADPHPRRRLP